MVEVLEFEPMMANITSTEASLVKQSIPNNLPHRVQPFFDREEEITRVTKLLLDPDVRIVSIVGSPGVGKTALALEVVHRLVENGQFADGVYWVYCRYRDRALEQILETIQRSLALLPLPTSRMAVRQYLAGHNVLLVLDKYDTIARDMEVLGFLTSLIGSSKVLIVSRDYAARPLQTAEVRLEVLSTAVGVSLFLETARSLGKTIPATEAAAVTEIVQLLANNPLAIQLAAFGVGSDTQAPQTLAKSIIEKLKHDQTADNQQFVLETIIDASTSRLGEQSTTLFRRLAVFASSFDELAIAQVCQVDEWQTAIGELQRAGLVDNAEKRYRLHPAVRAVAQSQLQQRGEQDLYEERAAAYYLHLAEAFEQFIHVREDLSIVSDIVRDELANILAGQEWYWIHARWNEVIAYGDALVNLWALGSLSEAHLTVMQRSLAASRASGDTGGEARFLYVLASIHQREGLSSEAVDLYEQSLASFEQTNNRLGVANTRLALGDLMLLQADLTGADELYRAALADFQAIGHRLGAANARKTLGDLALRQDDLAGADAQYQAALADFQTIGDRLGTANARKALGDLAQRQDDLVGADARYQAALAAFQTIGDRLGSANARKALGDLALRQADLVAAEQYYWAALVDFQAIGDRLGTANTRSALGDLALRQADLAEAEHHYWAALADYQAIGARLGVANTRRSLGDIALRQADLAEAEHHYWAALVDFQAIGDRLGTANTRSALGDLALRQADLAEAEHHYWAALADYQAIGARLGVANTRRSLGDIALPQADLAEAEHHYWAALAEFQTIGARLGEANVANDLASVHRLRASAAIKESNVVAQQAEYREALQYLDRSADLFKSIGDAASLAVVQRSRAHILDELEDSEFNEIIAAFARSLTASLTGASQATAMRSAGDIIKFGKHLIDEGRFHDALFIMTRLTESLEQIEQDANPIHEKSMSPAETEPNRMWLREPPPAYQTLTRYDQQVLQTTAVVKSALSVLSRVAAAKMNGVSQQDFDAALQALEIGRQIDRTTAQAFQLAQWVRDVTGFEFVELEDADEWPPRVVYLMHLAARHERDQNWEAAISAYQQTYELLGVPQSNRELACAAEVGFRLALCLKQAGRWTDALKQQEANVAAYKKLGDVAGKANVYMEMGHIYQMMNLYDLVLLYYGEAYYLYRQAAEEATGEEPRRMAQHGMANAKESLGNLEFQLKVLPQGISDLEEARRLYLDLGRAGKAAIIAQTLEEASSKQGVQHA